MKFFCISFPIGPRIEHYQASESVFVTPLVQVSPFPSHLKSVRTSSVRYCRL